MNNKTINLIITVFIVSIFASSCNQNKTESAVTKIKETEKTETTCFEDFKKRHNSQSDRIEDYYTKYEDGRKSEIRTMLSYESINCELKQNPNDATKINLIVVEWNINKGVAVCDSSAFANQDNNQMNGGDIESNRLLTPSSKKFMQNGQLFLEANSIKLSKIVTVPNRNVDYVSFDFVTNKGIFTIQESIKKLKTEKTTLSILFEEAEKLKLEVEKVANRFSRK